jgi:hypothetical protein
MCILEREREHIGSIWSRITCLNLPLAAAQSLLLEESPKSKLRFESYEGFKY